MPRSADPSHAQERARQRTLLERYHRTGDRLARDAFIASTMELAYALARRYRGRGIEYDDLVQVASTGLVNAVERFDVDRGVEFSTYAVPTILGELRRCFRDQFWAIRVPRDLQETALAIDLTIQRLTQVGRAPSVAEVAAETGHDEETVLEALEALRSMHAASLDAPIGAPDSDDAGLISSIGEVDGGYERAETAWIAHDLLDQLDERTSTVLRLRFGEDLTQSEIGALVGVSQMQISRILRQGLDQLAALAEEQDVPPAHRAPDKAA
jgi:RNA polymerase sigma-B factor